MNFDYAQNFSSLTNVCTREVFDQIICSEAVARICNEIRGMIDQMPVDATEEEEKAMKKRIDAKKCQLPIFAFHASYSNHRHTNESAIPSGLVSLDLDDVDRPTEFFGRLRDKALDMQLALAFISPSTRGLKLVFIAPAQCLTIEEAQEKLAHELGIESYLDAKTFDLARLAFAVPAGYILYRNDELLFNDQPAPEGFCTDHQLDQRILTEQAQAAQVESRPVPQSEIEGRYIDGIALVELLHEICQQLCGMPEPPVGKRNNCLYDATKLMRVYLNDDIDEAAKVMPTWGLEASSWWSTLRSAHSRPIAESTRQRAEEILRKLKRQKAMEQGESLMELPAPPKDLPPVFREFAHVTPEELLPAVLMSLLPILGTYGTNAKANLSDPDEEPEWRTPSFITIVSAPPASQKGIITNVYYRLTEELRRIEQPLMEQLNKYNANRKDANKPKLPIRLMPERLSMTSLSMQLENAEGQHLLLFTPEIDTLKSSNGSGAWNDLSTVFRKSIDNDLLGQIFASAESHCCNVPVCLNMLIESQPETLREFLGKRNVLNGLASRCIICDLPDSTGRRKLKVKKMSDFEWQNVMNVVNQLQKIGKVVTEEVRDEEGNLIEPAQVERQILPLPRTRKKLDQWGRMHQDHYLQTQENPAEDHFFRRAKMLGFHAAMVAYMCNGCRESNVVTEFGVWVAEYTLKSQLLHFGAEYNALYQKRMDTRADNIIALSQLSRFNLFDELPNPFTTADMLRVAQAHGRTLANPHNNLSRWSKNGMIVEIPSNSPMKLWQKTRPIA